MGTTSIGQIPVLLRHRLFNAVYWCENQDVYELIVAKKAALTAGIVALLAPVTIGVIGGRIVSAQSRTFVPWDSFSGGALMAAQTSAQSQGEPAPQFEVASIKPASPSAPQHGRLTRMEASLKQSPGSSLPETRL